MINIFYNVHFPVVCFDVSVLTNSCPHVCYDRLFSSIFLTFKNIKLQSNYPKLIVLRSQTFSFKNYRRRITAVIFAQKNWSWPLMICFDIRISHMFILCMKNYLVKIIWITISLILQLLDFDTKIRLRRDSKI